MTTRYQKIDVTCVEIRYDSRHHDCDLPLYTRRFYIAGEDKKLLDATVSKKDAMHAVAGTYFYDSGYIDDVLTELHRTFQDINLIEAQEKIVIDEASGESWKDEDITKKLVDAGVDAPVYHATNHFARHVFLQIAEPVSPIPDDEED